MVACNCSLSCESPINSGQLFSVVIVAAKIISMNSIFSILLTPFAGKKLFLFFHHGCIPDLLLHFRFHFDCQFQAFGTIFWEAEAWVSWKQMEWRVWSCRCCFLRFSSMVHVIPCLEPALQALAVKGSVLAKST